MHTRIVSRGESHLPGGAGQLTTSVDFQRVLEGTLILELQRASDEKPVWRAGSEYGSIDKKRLDADGERGAAPPLEVPAAFALRGRRQGRRRVEHEARVQRVAPRLLAVDGQPAGQCLVHLQPDHELPFAAAALRAEAGTVASTSSP